MHFISVPALTEEGLEVPVSPQTQWAVETLDVSDLNLTLKSGELTGHIRIEKIDTQVHVMGRITPAYETLCNRCAEPMVYHHDLALELYLAATPKSRPYEVQAEIDMPDLDFAYFDGLEFDLASIVHEHLLLELPVQFVCRKDCRGLCPNCGANLNTDACSCEKIRLEDSPWAALQKLRK